MSYLEQFHYQITGNGPHKLVFLHGLMGSGANWRKIVSQLDPQEWTILTFDQRGHGRSFHPSAEKDRGYRPEDFADDLNKILEELNWPSIHLVGHSLGGRNAINFASRYPEKVTSLVVEDIGPEASLSAAQKIQFLLDQVPTPFESRKEARRFLMEEFPHRVSHLAKPEVLAQYFYTNIETKDDGRADWRFSREGILASTFQGRSQDRWEEWKSIQCPVLVIRGSESEELSPEIFTKMQSVSDKIQGVEIADAGHWVHFDQPKVFAETLKGFLESAS